MDYELTTRKVSRIDELAKALQDKGKMEPMSWDEYVTIRSVRLAYLKEHGKRDLAILRKTFAANSGKAQVAKGLAQKHSIVKSLLSVFSL